MRFIERGQIFSRHFPPLPGLRNLDKPHIYVCSELIVCLVCGAAQFSVPAPELRLLAKGNPDASSRSLLGSVMNHTSAPPARGSKGRLKHLPQEPLGFARRQMQVFTWLRG